MNGTFIRFSENPDPVGFRVGKSPTSTFTQMLLDSAKEIEDNLKNPGTVLKIKELNKSMKILGETVKKVYPMGLPEYDPVRMELENREILAECLDAQLTKEL